MKTTLFTILLALPASLSIAQDRKPDAPREERKPDAPREEKKEPNERERAQAANAKMRAEIEQHLKAAMEEAAKLDEAGKKDAAENLRREAKERARAAMAEHDRGPQEHRREGPARAEIEGKLKHVEQAVAHLREAGMAEPAEQINQIANRLRAAMRGEGEPRREEPRREEAKRDEPRREGARPDNDVEALRREIQELRQAVRQLSERKSEH